MNAICIENQCHCPKDFVEIDGKCLKSEYILTILCIHVQEICCLLILAIKFAETNLGEECQDTEHCLYSSANSICNDGGNETKTCICDEKYFTNVTSN